MSRLASVLCCALIAVPLAAQSNAERMANDHYSRSHDYDLIHERVELSAFNWDSTSFEGQLAVTLVALKPAFDSVVLDAGHLLRIKSVTDRGGALVWSTAGDTLVVRLRHAVGLGDTVRFRLSYHGVVENGNGLTYIEADTAPPRRPQQIWSQGEDDNNHLWFPTYDFPNDKFTWEMLVTVPRGVTAVSNGRLVSDIANKDGTHTEWWSQEKPSVSYLASIVVAPLVRLHDSWKGRPVDYYVYQGDTTAARRLFRITPDMIQTYSVLTGVDYPWAKYAQTTVADFFGGMENVSATTLVDWIPDATSYADRPWYHYILIPHELAHQWFGDYVTTANWANMWLNEGFAEFMPGQYWRVSLGAHAAQDYYLDEYRQYMSADRRRRMPLAALGSNIIYPKGALVIQMLHDYLGDGPFWASVHRYLADHAYGMATTDDFRQAILAATGQNLDWFMDQWYYQAGYPEFKVAASYDSAAARLTLNVQQTQVDSSKADSTGLRYTTPAVFRMPVTIRVGTARGERTVRVQLTEREQLITVDSLGGSPTMVIFDDGNTILKTLTFDQPTDWLARQLSRDLNLWNRQWVINQLATRKDDAVAGASLATAATGADYYLTRAQAATALGTFPGSIGLAPLTRVLSDTSAAVRAAALHGLGTLGGDSALALARKAFDGDRSYEVRAAAVEVLGHAPGAERQAILQRALVTPSYQDVIGNAALSVIAESGDTALTGLVNAQVGRLSDAVWVLAALGRGGDQRAYDLLASHLGDARQSVRHQAAQAFEYAVPKQAALAEVTAAEQAVTLPAARVEVEALVKRIAARPERPAGGGD